MLNAFSYCIVTVDDVKRNPRWYYRGQRANIVDLRMLPELWSNVTHTVALTNLNLLFWCCKVFLVHQLFSVFFGYNISVIITVSVLRCLCTTVVTKPASYSWETQAMDGPEDKLLTYSTITWRYLKLCLIFTSPTYWNFKTIVLSVAPKTSLPHVPLYVTIGTFMSSAAMNFFLLLVTL